MSNTAGALAVKNRKAAVATVTVNIATSLFWNATEKGGWLTPCQLGR